MPSCGSQCFLCDVPIRFDTYKGCSHACAYCFAQAKQDLKIISTYETPNQLKSFIEGKRTQDTKWCDWDIPLHWGGLSDPFQPVERSKRVSYECLKIFKETQYPFIVSTKGKLIAEPEYLDLLAECNCVVQISMVCSKYDKLELGCPTYEERLKIASIVSPRVKRVIARIQPYMHEVFQDVYDNLERLAEAGVYGVIIEGMKFKKKKKGLIKVGGDFVYPYDVILNDFLRLQKRAHELGLKIYAGENRIRRYGDSLTCCGSDGLEGFVPNTYNINHIINGDNTEPTEKMLEVGTAAPFRTLYQNSVDGRRLAKNSFADEMKYYAASRPDKVKEIFGIK